MAEGFVPKKRKRATARDHPISFLFENPLDGAFKNMAFTKSILKESGVFLTSTSYCHYGLPYRKRTVFLSTLAGFHPALPCPSNACAAFKTSGRHASVVKEQSAAEKNSIPAKLVDLEVQAWLASHPDAEQRFLFIDVFAGYGSVAERVRCKFPQVSVYANDIVRRKDNNVELDMSKFDLTFLIKLALLLNFGLPDGPSDATGLVEWLRGEKIAVLLHISTPCNTYSVDGMAANRDKITLQPRSALARAHDRMNTDLMQWLRESCL